MYLPMYLFKDGITIMYVCSSRPVFYDTRYRLFNKGFRFRFIKHGTIEQIQIVIDFISNVLLLNISQTFEKVWHTDLLYKLNMYFPWQIYLILQSWLQNQNFFVHSIYYKKKNIRNW